MNPSLAARWARRGAAVLCLALWSLMAAGQGAPNAQVTIREPQADATVHDNSGNLRVAVEVAPALRPGERLVITIDGVAVAQGTSMVFDIAGVDRGTHDVQASVVDASGAVRGASAPVTFHLWRASRLFPKPD